MMRYLKEIIFMIAVTVLPTLEAKELEVFVLTGQSNSLGIIKDGEDFNIPEDKVDKKIRFFWVDRDPRANIVSTSKGKIDHLQIQKYDNDSNNAHWGLEMEFARTLYKSGKRNIMIIKASRGGGGNQLWYKESSDHHMYDAVLEAVKEATDLLKAKKVKFTLRGLLYLQGESDGVNSKIADERAKTLLTNLQKDLPRAKYMKMVIGGINGNNKNQDLVRKLHAELAKKDKNISFVETDDLRKDETYKDRLHFNNKAKLEIGKRFAKSYLGLIKRK